MSYEAFKEFSNQLLTLRTRASLTQGALADAVGAHRRSVQNWEAGVTYPKAETLQRLLVVLVQHRAFAPGQELAEARALWDLVEGRAGLSFPAFDAVWMTGLLAASDGPGAAQQSARPPEQHAQTAGLLDWGEAISVSALYGRERELAELQQWLLVEQCRIVMVLGLGGIGKSSLVLRAAEAVAPHFEFVLFRSLQNAPPLAGLLDQLLSTVGAQIATPAAPPELVPDKITLLVQRFRERRCLLILDNFETVLEPGTLSGTYRDGYADYGALLQALSAREHQSCVVITSREKPTDLAPFEGRATPVRTRVLAGLAGQAAYQLLEQKDLSGPAAAVDELARLYGGNPLALKLVAEPIHELFGGDLVAFLASGNAFSHSVGTLLEQQFARSTSLEQAIMYWLAVERELLPLATLQARLSETAPSRTVLAALESLRRRMLIERGPDEPAFTLQPVIMEYMTDRLAQIVPEELATGVHSLLRSHCLVQATAKEYVRRSQERLIAAPILERLDAALGAQACEERLLGTLERWRDLPSDEAGHGPGNVVNLLRLRRGQLSGLDLSRLAIRQAYFQGLAMHETSLAHSTLHDCRFTDTFGAITAVSVSGDGAYWAASSKCGELRVWLAGTQTPYRAWQAHSDSTWDIAFSPDRSTLASCSWDGTVKLWDIEANTLCWSARLPWHLQKVAFAPDGLVLASCGGGPEVWLLDAASGAKLHALAHPVVVSSITWSPQGRLLVTGDRVGTVRFWRVDKDAAPVCTHELSGHTKAVLGLAFDPSGLTLASASWDGTVRLWDVVGASVRQVLAGHTGRVTRVVWSDDGTTLATGGSDHTIRLWDVERGRYRAALHEHSSSVLSLAFARGDRYLVSGSEDGTLRVWELTSEQCIRVIEGYAILLYDIDWSPDGRQLVTGGADGAVTVWDADGIDEPRILHEHRGSAMSVGWAPGGEWVASSEWGDAIELCAVGPGATSQTLQHPAEGSTIRYGLAWSPDGRRLANGTHRRGIEVFDLGRRQERWPATTLPTWLRRVAWRPDGAQIAAGGDLGAVYLWDAADAQLVRELGGHQGMVTAVAWSPDGTQLASGSLTQGELFLWNAEGELLRRFADAASITSAVAWGASEDVLVSGGGDGVLRWWDVGSGGVLHAHMAHQGTVTALRRSPDGTKLASCGIDGAVTVWDLQRAEPLRTMRRRRPYERLNITGTVGITAAQRLSLQTLGAAEQQGAVQAPAGIIARGRGEGTPTLAIAQGLGRQDAPAALPLQPTSFIGRSAEIAAIARITAEPSCRLLTLLGPGGVGKTRLAIEVAARQEQRFADGVGFVALASVGQAELIAAAIGEALGFRWLGQGDLEAHLIAQLRERQMLLVLDNFEHVLKGADLVAALLAGAPRTTIIVTSRVRLGLQAEWLFDVEGLAYPASSEAGADTPLPAEPAGYSAVQLFMQRAAQVQPRLSFPEPALAAVGRICQQVAGMPLAIELAAASVRSASIGEIEQQLRLNYDSFAVELRDLPVRHRSMRAAFDHSWELLSASERALWSRLAVFHGGWTLEAAEQVVGASQAALLALVDRSLIYQSLKPRRAGRDDDPRGDTTARFGMLEPIREYALGRLVADADTALTWRRHARYYAALAASAQPELMGPNHGAWMRRLNDDHDNLRAALDWALREGEAELGLGLGAALTGYWRIRGHLREGRQRLNALLTAFAQPLAPRIAVLLGASHLADEQGDFAQARALGEEMLLDARTLGAPHWIAEALALRGKIIVSDVEVPAAIACFEEAMAMYRDEGNTRGVANMLLNLGRARLSQGALPEARQHFVESLALSRQTSDAMGVIYALLHLGIIVVADQDAVVAFEIGSEALRLACSCEFERMVGHCIEQLGAVAILRGQPARCARLFAAASRIFSELGHKMQPPEQARTEHWVGVARSQLDADTFTTAWREGYALSREALLAEALEPPRIERSIALS